MDNLTHSLVGVFLSRAGLGKLTPHATLLAVVAANIPDLDGVTMLMGGTAYLRWHRAWTHSLLLTPVVALIPVGLLWVWKGRQIPWLKAWLVSFVALLSHLALDWTNTYGIRLLAPVTRHWYRGDLTEVVDPVIWTVLLLGVAAPWLSNLVGGEIGAKRSRGTGWAWAALLLVLAYDSLRAWTHAQALAELNNHTYDGAQPRRVAAIPRWSSPWRWRGIVETSADYRIFDLNLLETFRAAGGTVLVKGEATPALAAAGRDPSLRAMLDWSAFPLWRAVPAPAGDDWTRVELRDLRFGQPPAERFLATVEVGPQGQVRKPTFTFGSPTHQTGE